MNRRGPDRPVRPAEGEGCVSREILVLMPLWYVVFLLSITCHEAAHALAAHRGGDDTAYLGGQVSLNPLPHVAREPVGTVIVPMVSYLLFGAGGSGARWMIGWASAPYDGMWEDRHPRRAAAMAAAGPAANLLLAAIGFVVLKAGLSGGLWFEYRHALDHLVTTGAQEGTLAEGLGRFCSVLLSLNIILFFFNLLPLPPMDGASVLAGFFAPMRRFRERLRGSPMLALLGLIVAWRVFPYVFNPVYDFVLLWLFA
jgi:Zn-dependent protease